jgi:DNA replication protein DnaC
MKSFKEAYEEFTRGQTPLADKLAALRARLPEVPATVAVPACGVCGGLGIYSLDVPLDDARFGRTYLCTNRSCQARADLLERRRALVLEKAAIPKRYRSFTFASWDAAADGKARGKEAAREVAALWVATPGHWINLALNGGDGVQRNGLILRGGYGVGKTGLVAALVNACAELDPAQQPLYIRAQDVIETVQSTYGQDSDTSRDDILSVLKSAEILILDDFNLNVKSDDRRDILEAVIRYRTGNELPIIITCNSTLAELRSEWGSRTVEVLLEACHWIEMGGDKLRDTRQLGAS